jgi:phosphoglucosamine mutase
VEAALEEPPVWADSASWARPGAWTMRPGRYIEFCKSTFANDLTLKGMKIVVDAAHGAAYHIAPKVFHELGAEVIAIGCAPDGLNINHEVGATHPEALVRPSRPTMPILAWRWMAMPTACNWWTLQVGCTTAMNCST